MEPIQEGATSRSITTSLLRRAKDLDPISWERLVHIFHPLVYRWIRHWGVPEADAPDLVQNVFLSVYSAIGRFERESQGATFRGWLCSISRNKANDFFRIQSPAQANSELLAAVPQRDFQSSEANDNHEIMHRILEMIATDFSPQTFEVFRQCIINGRDTSDVAAEFGMKKSTVREAKRRVLARLREECAELLGSGQLRFLPENVD